MNEGFPDQNDCPDCLKRHAGQSRCEACLSKLLFRVEQERARIEAQLKLATEALEFYESDEAWGCGEPVWTRPPIYKDGGNKARDTLAKIREGK